MPTCRALPYTAVEKDRHQQLREAGMADVVFVALSLVFFAASILYVLGCERV